MNRPFFRVSPFELSIKAIGAPGYSMVQELMLITQLAPRLGGKLVVWFIYPGNDLTDNLSPAMTTFGYRMPFLLESDIRGGWDIIASHVQPDRWFAEPIRPDPKDLRRVWEKSRFRSCVRGLRVLDRPRADRMQTGRRESCRAHDTLGHSVRSGSMEGIE